MIDPLSTIAAALAAGAAAAMKDTAAQTVKDAYNGVKALIQRKSGNAAPVSAALTLVESKPDDPSRRRMLQDVLKEAGVDRDAEVLKLAQTLAEAVKQHAPQITQYNISAGGVINDGDNYGNINTGTQMTNNYFGQSSADPADAAGTGLVASVEGRKVNKLLNDYFNMDDVEGLCFEMGIDEDNLRGETKAGKARALVQHVEANNRLSELRKLMRVLRPNLRDQLQ